MITSSKRKCKERMTSSKKNLKNRILLPVIIATLLITTLSGTMTAFADTRSEEQSVPNGTVAIVTDGSNTERYFTSIDEAVEYAISDENSTMALVADISITKPIFNDTASGKTLNLEMNGHNINCQGKTHAFEVKKDDTLNLTNSVSGQGGKILNGYADGCGGAINFYGNVYVKGVTFENCKSETGKKYGGAICSIAIGDPDKAKLKLEGCTFKNCYAENDGGAIYLQYKQKGSKSVEISSVSDDTNVKPNAIINNCTFEGCSVKLDGGAIKAWGGVIEMHYCTVKNCSSFNDGGFAHLMDGALLYLYNTTITGCTGNKGAAVYIGFGYSESSIKETALKYARAFFLDTTVTGNTSGHKDGGHAYGAIYAAVDSEYGTPYVGGKTIIKDNKGDNGETANLVFEYIKGTGTLPDDDTRLMIKDAMPLTEGAEVHVSINEKGTDAKEVRFCSTYETGKTCRALLEKSLPYIKVDRLADDTDLKAFMKADDDDNMWMGPDDTIELISFKMTSLRLKNVEAKIDRATKTITVDFPFKDSAGGYSMEPYEIEYNCGKTGTICVGKSDKSRNHPYKNAVVTYKDSSIAEEVIFLEHNGKSEYWIVYYNNKNVPVNEHNLTVRNGNFKIERGYNKNPVYGGETVTATASCSEGDFIEWIIETGNPGLTPEQLKSKSITFTMPEHDVTLIAKIKGKTNYAEIEGGFLKTESGDYVTNGYFTNGYSVKIALDVDKIPVGQVFDHWETNIPIFPYEFQYYMITTNFNMPEWDVYIEAVYRDVLEGYCELSVTNGYVAGSVLPVGYFDANEMAGGTAYDDFTTIDGRIKNTFKEWVVLKGDVKLEDKFKLTDRTIQFKMPDEDVAIEALYNTEYYYNVSVVNGTLADGQTSGMYTKDSSVTVTADKAQAGYKFDHWKITETTYDDWNNSLLSTEGGDQYLDLANVEIESLELPKESKDEKYTFNMPAKDVTLEAVYVITTHKVTLVNAHIGGKTELNLTYGTEMHPELVSPDIGMIFDHWEATGLELSEAEKENPYITPKMPDNDVVLKAVFIAPHTAYATCATINGETAGIYYKGAYLEVVADVISGFVFDHWESSDPELIEEQERMPVMKLYMPDNDVSFEPVYVGATVEPHKITAVKGFVNGQTEEYNYAGSKVIVKADISLNREFDYWNATGIVLTDEQKESPVMELYMPDNEVTIEGVYTDVPVFPYTLEVVNGTCYGETTGDYYEGSTLEIRANAMTGMVFDHWEATGITLTEEQKTAFEMAIIMPASDVNLTAVYTLTPITPNTIAVIDGKVEGQTVGAFFQGSHLNVTADVIEGSAFNCWVAEGITLTEEEKTKPALNIIMPGNDVVLKAVYVNVPISPYEINVTNGTVNGKTHDINYGGTYLVVKADISVGKKFDHWEATGLVLSDEEKTSPVFSTRMPNNDVDLVAVFYNIPIEPNEVSVINGNVYGETEGAYYAGSILKAEADGKPGQIFDHWEAEGITLTEKQSESSVFSFIMPDNDVNLLAVFMIDPIYPRFVNVINGTVDGKTEALYYAGSRVEVIADSAAGVMFDCWKATGIELTKEQAASAKTEFIMPDNAVVLEAEYVLVPVGYYKLNVINGTAEGKTEIAYYPGSKVSVSADTISGKYFAYWEAEGITLSNEQKYSKDITFYMPENNVKLTAVFTDQPIPVPKTGDTNISGIYLALILLCTAVLAGLLIYKNKTTR